MRQSGLVGLWVDCPSHVVLCRLAGAWACFEPTLARHCVNDECPVINDTQLIVNEQVRGEVEAFRQSMQALAEH